MLQVESFAPSYLYETHLGKYVRERQVKKRRFIKVIIVIGGANVVVNVFCWSRVRGSR